MGRGLVPCPEKNEFFSLEMASFAAYKIAKHDKIHGQFALASPTPNSEGLAPFPSWFMSMLSPYTHYVKLMY